MTRSEVEEQNSMKEPFCRKSFTKKQREDFKNAGKEQNQAVRLELVLDELKKGQT